jgi:hypothetical protein
LGNPRSEIPEITELREFRSADFLPRGTFRLTTLARRDWVPTLARGNQKIEKSVLDGVCNPVQHYFFNKINNLLLT